MTDFVKGHKKMGGRGKGVTNKVTADKKALMSALVDYGLKNAERWLERTAKKNPARALDALAKLAEYALPKLAKTDVNVSGGVQVLERRFYGTAPKVEVLNTPKTPELPAPDTVDAEELI